MAGTKQRRDAEEGEQGQGTHEILGHGDGSFVFLPVARRPGISVR
jgi:hypothetical protein